MGSGQVQICIIRVSGGGRSGKGCVEDRSGNDWRALILVRS